MKADGLIRNPPFSIGCCSQVASSDWQTVNSEMTYAPSVQPQSLMQWQESIVTSAPTHRPPPAPLAWELEAHKSAAPTVYGWDVVQSSPPYPALPQPPVPSQWKFDDLSLKSGPSSEVIIEREVFSVAEIGDGEEGGARQVPWLPEVQEYLIKHPRAERAEVLEVLTSRVRFDHGLGNTNSTTTVYVFFRNARIDLPHLRALHPLEQRL